MRLTIYRKKWRPGALRKGVAILVPHEHGYHWGTIRQYAQDNEGGDWYWVEMSAIGLTLWFRAQQLMYATDSEEEEG